MLRSYLAAFKAKITNSKTEKGVWVEFPNNNDETMLDEAFETIEADKDDPDTWYISAYTSDHFADDTDFGFGEHPSIEDLEDYGIRIENLLEKYSCEKVEAMWANFPIKPLDAIENEIDRTLFFAEIGDDEELGETVISEGFFLDDVPENLVSYLDYEAIGRDFRLETGGFFTNGHFIAMN